MTYQKSVWLQDFYAEVEPIRLADPLSILLGAQAEGELLVFNYTDAVQMAGHSCPAVSGAYKITALALKALWPEGGVPIRGTIRVLIKGGPEDLAYGPQAQVISLITGASGRTGFKGLGGRYARNNRLFFDASNPEFNTYIFQREDNRRTVKVVYNPQAIGGDPRTGDLIGPVLDGTATPEQKALFIELWQANVRKILLEDDSYPGLFEVTEIEGFEFPASAGSI